MDYFQDDIFKDLPATGLYLVNNNTGTGKTHFTVKGMVKNALDPDFTRKQVFCTGIWNNIPVKELKDEYKRLDAEDRYEQDVVVITSVFSSVQDNWNTYHPDIPDALSKT